jgi:hypothetical protein
MKKYSHYLIVACMVLLISCTTTVTQIPDSTSQDAIVYQTQCGSCHSVPHPARLSFLAWVNVLPEMNKRMIERGREKLNEQDTKQILSYLKLYAR